MRTDRDIELKRTKEYNALVNEVWEGKERELQIHLKINQNLKTIKKSKQRQREIHNEIKIIKRQMRKELGMGARIDEELDEEFEIVNNVIYVSKVTKGMLAL